MKQEPETLLVMDELELGGGAAESPCDPAARLSLAVREGEQIALGLRGPSRALFCDLVLGIATAERGEVRVFGRDPVRNTAHLRQRLGHFPAIAPAPPSFLLRDVLALHRWGYSTWDEALAATLLGQLSFPGNLQVASLTPEQLGRVQLCCALAHRPRLVLFDGPPSAAAELTAAVRAHLPPTTAIVMVADEGETSERARDELPAGFEGQHRLLSFRGATMVFLFVALPMPTWFGCWAVACWTVRDAGFRMIPLFRYLPLRRLWRLGWSVLAACGLLAILTCEVSWLSGGRPAAVLRYESSDSRTRFDRVSLRTAPFLWDLAWGPPPTVAVEGEHRYTPIAYPLLPGLPLNAYDAYEAPPGQPELLAAQWARLLRDEQARFSLAYMGARRSDGVEEALHSGPLELGYRKTSAWYGLKLWVMGLPLFAGAGASSVASRRRQPSVLPRRGATIAIVLGLFVVLLLIGYIVEPGGWEHLHTDAWYAPFNPLPWMALLGVFLRSAEDSPWPYLALGVLSSWGAYQGAQAWFAHRAR